jgi:hypothetical protein
MATSRAAPRRLIRPADGPYWTNVGHFKKTPPHLSKNQLTARLFRTRLRERVLRCAARRHRDPWSHHTQQRVERCPSPRRPSSDCRAAPRLIPEGEPWARTPCWGGLTPACRLRTGMPLHRSRPSPKPLTIATLRQHHRRLLRWSPAPTVAGRDENGSDTNGYCGYRYRYHFHP